MVTKDDKYKNRWFDSAHQELKTVEEENNRLSGDLGRLHGRIPTTRRCTVCGRPHRSGSDVNQKSQPRRHANTGKDNIQRPFYRNDCSLSQLPHYSTQAVEYTNRR